jgi:hypothetical protein
LGSAARSQVTTRARVRDTECNAMERKGELSLVRWAHGRRLRIGEWCPHPGWIPERGNGKENPGRSVALVVGGFGLGVRGSFTGSDTKTPSRGDIVYGSRKVSMAIRFSHQKTFQTGFQLRVIPGCCKGRDQGTTGRLAKYCQPVVDGRISTVRRKPPYEQHLNAPWQKQWHAPQLHKNLLSNHGGAP